MKNLISIFATLLIGVISPALASGNGSLEDRVSILKGNDRFKVLYTCNKTSLVKICIRNEKGNLLRSDRIKTKEGFMKPYNTQKLRPGIYTFEITDPFGTATKEIYIEPDNCPDKGPNGMMYKL